LVVTSMFAFNKQI